MCQGSQNICCLIVEGSPEVAVYFTLSPKMETDPLSAEWQMAQSHFIVLMVPVEHDWALTQLLQQQHTHLINTSFTVALKQSHEWLVLQVTAEGPAEKVPASCPTVWFPSTAQKDALMVGDSKLSTVYSLCMPQLWVRW